MLLHLSTTNSTNEDAYELALKGAAHGFTVLADSQLAGKGRLGRNWISPPGLGFYCSIILRPNLAFSDFPKLTLTTGLALCTVIETLLPNSPFGLKWPNDLYCNKKKCGGILVESSSVNSGTGKSFVIVGIGLNVNSVLEDFPEGLRQKITSLRIESNRYLDIQSLLLEIHKSTMAHLEIHEKHGFPAILKEWRKRDVLLGEEMQWLTRKKVVITGRGLGPDENGQLIARDRNGKLHEILSGDVQLAK